MDRAQVDRGDFDREFADLDACAVEVWNELQRCWLAAIRPFEQGLNWRESLRLQAWELYRFIEEDVDRMRFQIGLQSALELVQGNRDVALAKLADYVQLGRYEREATSRVNRAVAEGIVGAIWEGVALNIKEPTLDGLREGVPMILFLATMAYLGEKAAEEEMLRAPEDIARHERGELEAPSFLRRAGCVTGATPPTSEALPSRSSAPVKPSGLAVRDLF